MFLSVLFRGPNRIANSKDKQCIHPYRHITRVYFLNVSSLVASCLLCTATLESKANLLKKKGQVLTNSDVLLTVNLSMFISIINQLDAQNLFHNKIYFMPLNVSSTCAHHQEVKIA